MRKSVLVFVGLAVAIVIVAFVVSRRKESSQTPSTGSEIASQSGDSSTNESKLRQPPKYFPQHTNVPGVTNRVPAPSAVTNANYMTNWEDKLDVILTSEKPDPDKAKEMIEMFPHLSPDAQEEIAHHISNLNPDENYTLGQFLTNSALPEPVLDVFTEDVLNRP